MLRKATATGCFVGWCLLCSPACQTPYPPMDTASLPSTTTSAQPQYISTEPEHPSTQVASEDASANEQPGLPWPASVSLTSDRTATCPQKHCWRSWMTPRPAETNTPATAAYPDLGTSLPVAVWHEILKPNVRLDYPRSKGIGLFGVVLRGIITVAPSEGTTLAAVDPWKAFVAPGSGVGLTADASGGFVLLVAYPLDGSLDRAIAALRTSEKAVYWDKRPGTFAVQDLLRDDTSMCMPTGHAAIGADAGPSPVATLGLLCPYAGSNTQHLSDNASQDHGWEVYVRVGGTGTVSLASGGDVSLPNGRGKFDVEVDKVIITVPPGVTYFVNSPTPLQVIRLLIPPR